jgi:predicted O-methyltransferase YrrM
MNFGNIEHCFDANIRECLGWFPPGNQPEVRKIKSFSHSALCSLLATERNYYDLVYVDGSHHAADTLADIMLCWFLLRIGGVMILDDYLWKEPTGRGAIHEPKIAIDAFTTIFGQRLRIIMDAPLRQLYFVKRED